MIYHIGLLMSDRQNRVRNPRLHTIARQMYEDYENGKAVLAQRKISDGVYEYHAFYPTVNHGGRQKHS